MVNPHSIQGTVDPLGRGFLYIIGQNELRIRLADTTHEAITVSVISDFNLHLLGLF